MKEEHLHISDEQLLLHASGEVPASRSGQIQVHLEACSQCRNRLQELESTLAEFGEAHRDTWDAVLPPVDERSVQLRTRLAELEEQDHRVGSFGLTWTNVVEHRNAMTVAAIMIAACLLVAIRLSRPTDGSHPIVSRSMPVSVGHWEEPDLRLTPGATVTVSENEICSGTAARPEPVVPVSLKRKVFEEYGLAPRPDAYEVDYLITPELGGATDIRNLWPEPYHDTVWNAHVKDQLEDRLHRMVCHGDVDLATAQHDISADWIAAYRKYFHVSHPLADSSSSDSASLGPSLPALKVFTN
ncbi:MAG: hypothetical protein WB729_19305 [Candidatus Sulfotelmatobacter sp.]